jgi:hypothetical protein
LLFCAWDGAATIKIKLAVAVPMARNFDNRILLLLLLDTLAPARNNFAPATGIALIGSANQAGYFL